VPVINSGTVAHTHTQTNKQTHTHTYKTATEGFPVSPITAHWWAQNETQLNAPTHTHNNQHELLSPLTGKAPTAGEVFKNPTLAETMCDLAEGGKKAFYEGRVGKAIVEMVQSQVHAYTHTHTYPNVHIFSYSQSQLHPPTHPPTHTHTGRHLDPRRFSHTHIHMGRTY
jgi:hypothetical protein